jgi:hypothetical protein
MPPCDESALPSQSFHLNIKDDVGPNLGVGDGRRLILWQDVECHSYIAHFLVQRIFPQGVSVFQVDSECLLDCPWNPDTKLVGLL